MISTADAIGLTVRVEDRFGDHGLIGVLIAVPAEEEPGTLRVDTWLMSCRVIGRTVEEYFVVELLERAHRLGYRRNPGGIHLDEEERAGQRAVRPDGIPTGRGGRRRLGVQ
jgi:predicted enzyme involved in methoxymalonyl-ACP biosynthesis